MRRKPLASRELLWACILDFLVICVVVGLAFWLTTRSWGQTPLVGDMPTVHENTDFKFSDIHGEPAIYSTAKLDTELAREVKGGGKWYCVIIFPMVSEFGPAHQELLESIKSGALKCLNERTEEIVWVTGIPTEIPDCLVKVERTYGSNRDSGEGLILIVKSDIVDVDGGTREQVAFRYFVARNSDISYLPKRICESLAIFDGVKK